MGRSSSTFEVFTPCDGGRNGTRTVVSTYSMILYSRPLFPVRRCATGVAEHKNGLYDSMQREFTLSGRSRPTMTSRATMTRAAHEEIPGKHRRVEMSLLEGVNDNCMLLILGFLSAEDLNSFAICSRRCREARSSPSLDQTRTGTIICSQNTSVLKIYNLQGNLP